MSALASTLATPLVPTPAGMTSPPAPPSTPSGGRPDLAALARGAGQGNSGALDGLVAALATPVRRFLVVRISGQPADVLDDCVQEALARIATAARAGRAPGGAGWECTGVGVRVELAAGERVMAWALTVARRAALNYLRSAASGVALRARGVALAHVAASDGPKHHGSVGSDALLGAGPFAHGRAGGGRPRTDRRRPETSEAGVVQALASEDLSPAREVVCTLAVAAQDALPPHGAELVWARVIAGASWDDLARQFGTTPGAAKGRYRRALGILRRTCLGAIDALPPSERAEVRAHLRLAAPPV